MFACSSLFRVFTCVFIFLCSCTSNLIYAKSFEYYTSILSSAWNISPSDIEPIKFRDGSILRPFFVRKFRGPAFACGFYSIDFSNSYLFAIFAAFTDDTEDASPIGHLDSGFPQVVWSANRNHLVGIMASLQLTVEEGLVLADADGSVAWSINTLGKSVLGLNLTDEGNLVLFDEKNMTIWQSFDHPTDSLVLGQKLKVGQKLVPSISPTNWTANGLISLSLTSRGLYAQMETSPLQIYYPVRFDFPNTGNESNYLQFQKGLLCLFKNSSRNSTLFTSIPFSAQFLRLDVDGHLRAYSWVTFQWTALDDLLIRDYGDCGYPTVCGRYGICSSMGQCSCLPSVGGTTYFVQTDYKQPKLGCSEIVPLSCGASENQSFVEITDITYFTYSTDSESVPDATNIDSESCKAACAKNCSCKAVFFQGLAGVRNGSCYYISEVFSLMNVDLQNTSSVYIKVQNVPTVANVSTGQKNHVRTIVGFCLGSLFALIIFVAATILFPKRREQDMYEVEEDYLDQVPGMPTRFRYDDLKVATADFSKKLGQGGFGSVYHGNLMDGTKIAVKCLNDFGQIKKSFLAEVETIGSIHHVNLVRLVGFCADKSHRLLVYEYMPHGSLDRWIYSKQSDNPLDWQRRKKIILDIAKGLNYLHEDCRQKIIHLDIKPQNILLDGNFGAKVADFGLSKLAERDESQVVTTMRGTPGYLAPEWLSAVITEKVDVYAFGIVILEIVCGRRAFDHSQSQEDTHLVCLFRRKAEENHLLEIIDQRISCTQSNSQAAVDTMKIAAWCLQGDSTKRPSMSTVIKVLDGVSEVPDDLDYNFPFSSPGRELCLTNGEFCGTSSPRFPSVLSYPRLVYAQFPRASLPITWRLNQQERHKFVGESVVRTILLREDGNMTYACGFYCEADCDGQSYLFSVLIMHSHVAISPAVDAYFKPNVVWSANRNNLVTINAVLELTNEGDLVLKDSDGKTAVWSAGTSGKDVAGINLTDVGNLVLFDENTHTVWQSFDHPTDTLLRDQKFKVGQRLVPSVSESNWTEQSLFSLSLTSQGLFAVAGSKRPLLYYARPSNLSDTGYVTLINGCLFMFLNTSALGEVYRVLNANPHAVSAKYIRMDYDGHIRAYGYDDLGLSMIMGDMLSFEVCEYPLACGPYGICFKGQCTCPPPMDGMTYFSPISSKRPELGCSPIVPLTCGDTRNQTFLHLRGVTYFNFTVDLEGIDVDGCIDACAKNCSCKAAIFMPSLNNSYGKCFIPSELLSLIRVDRPSYEWYNHTIYLKVRKPMDTVDGTTNKAPGTKGQKSSRQKVDGVGVGVAIPSVMLILVALFFLWRKMYTNDETDDDCVEEVLGMPARFSYADLKFITEDFSQKLGEGGFGAVFRGTLRDGTKVAVKCLNSSRHMKKSFLNEVGTIGSIHHINLVNLIGFCAEKSHRLLVYEYMSKGSLDKWIFENSSGSVLDWQRRRDIILDVAKGLHYLHEQCKQKIVHLDIKPQNILLNENLQGKVSDFGLSKLVDRENDQVVTTSVRGTPGYLAPEWLNGMVTEKADVYSFGIVVLEIILGRRVVDTSHDLEDEDLLKLFERKAEEGRLTDLIEAYSNGLKLDDSVVTDALRVMGLACWCLQTDFRNRPLMSTVIKVMDEVMEVKDDLTYDFAHPIFTKLEAPLTVLSPSILSGPR